MLDEYKHRSVECCNIWIAVGSPSEGSTYHNMRQAKAAYKAALNECKKDSETQFADDLFDSLMAKDMDGFWRTWKSKFGRKSLHSKIVEGCCRDDDIVHKFKAFSSQVSIPNSLDIHQRYKEEFLNSFKGYSIHECHDNFFTVSDIDEALSKMKKGKSTGLDKISTEHLVYAHPSLVMLLKVLFNCMLQYGLVPDGFGKGIIIPLLKDPNSDATICDNYRGISLSSSISKVFEYAVLNKYGVLLTTDCLQFGFKNSIGCSDALYTVKSTIDYFVKNGCTLSISALDISKAFDRVSFYALFSKLMHRKVPKEVINVLLSWYTKSSMQVRWNDSLSTCFRTSAGVRQGGVLSPILFALYIEDILGELKKQNKGCKIGGVFLGCFLYADDILLLSQSVTCMQSMLDICNRVACYLDLKFNTKKSVTMRIGKRYKYKCSAFLLDGIALPRVEECKYLGVILREGCRFSRSFCTAKIKFYRCFNAIYSKAFFASEEVLINLLNSFRLPLVTFACEAVWPSRSDVRILDKLITVAFQKIFHTFDVDVISNAKLYFGLDNVDHLLRIRQKNFFDRYFNKGFSFSHVIYSINDRDLLCAFLDLT